MPQVPAIIPPKVPQLVEADGRTPLRRETLSQEIASASLMTARSVLTGHPAEGLTPMRLAALLTGAENGDPVAYLELAEQMEEKDLHYLSVLGTRKRQVAQLPITVHAASTSAEDERNAELIRGWIDRDTLESDLFDLLDAVGKGFSILEMIWNTSVTPWLPERLEWRDQRWFQFDRVDGRTPLLRGAGMPTPLEPYKFIVHNHVAKSGLPIRGGLARPVAWGYLFKNFAIKDWVQFAEIFGLPFRIGRYDNGATEADIRTLMRAVANISSDAAAVIPKSMEVEFVDGKANGNADIYEKLARYIDGQISKAVLGQTATTDSEGGGLGGSGKEHNDVRGDIERADAKLVASTLNRDLVRPMIDLNYGPQAKYPRIVIGREETTDLKRLGDFLQVAVPLGLRVGEQEIRERAGLSEPTAGERILSGAPPVQPGTAPEPFKGLPAPGGGPFPAKTAATRFLGLLSGLAGQIATARETPNAPGVETGDAVDDFAAANLGDWEAIVDPLLAPVVALLDGATTLEDVQARLATAAEQMDPAALTEMLARGMFGARLVGAAGLAIGDTRGGN